MLNVVVWGNQEQYDLFVNQIRAEELKGNICITGIVATDNDDARKFDGYRVISKRELSARGG